MNSRASIRPCVDASTERVTVSGEVVTVDTESAILKSVVDQRPIEQLPLKGRNATQLMRLTVGVVTDPAGRNGAVGTSDIAFGPNGRLFISDGYGNARILEYSAKGERIKQWGRAGSGPGEFRQPHGIAVDDRGIIYVADRLNARLQRFDLSGKYLGEWDDLGRVTTVTFRGGTLWIGTQFNNEPNEADGWQMKIDRKTGKILGYAESGRSHHILNVTERGELLAGARPDIVWRFRPAK